MNKKELINAIAEQAELSKKDAAKAVEAFVEVVTNSLKEDDKVQPERATIRILGLKFKSRPLRFRHLRPARH